MNAERIAFIRTFVFGLTGLTCLVYGCLAIALERPDPMPWWIPAAFGLASTIVITLSFLSANKAQVDMAKDEGYKADDRNARANAYWIAIWLYPLAAAPLINGWLTYPTVFAAMGTITGAAYLLLFVWYDLRGRG